MITGELRGKVDKIWEYFWTGGITNPLTVIEQFTYLLYIKGLDDREQRKEKDSELLGLPYEGLFPKDQPELRWSTFSQMGPEEMFETMSQKVFPFIKGIGGNGSAYSQHIKDAVFVIPSPVLLSRVVAGISELPKTTSADSDVDTLGDLYEYLLSKLQSSGTNGQFRTPRQIIDMMVELMKPTPQDTIVDPAAGTAGFLVSASEYMRKHHNDLFYTSDLKEHFHNTMFNGFEIDTTMLRISTMNMMLHGIDNPNIRYQDSLNEQNKEAEKYSLILANPPFKGSLDYDAVADDLLKVTKTKKTELLFLALMLRLLKKGGRAAVIVPDGVLFGASNAHKAIRKEILENNKLEAVISMPSGIFKPYAGVSTGILIFTKTGSGGTDNVWFYDMENDGFSLNDNRSPIVANDIPDIIKRFHNLEDEIDNARTDKSFLVPFDEIKENDYDLSINKYQEIKYEEIEYEDPHKILSNIFEFEKEINNSLKELEGLLSGK
ncbi:MAG TPA: class I SAM-dependent DNA methyltransferase [Erysipelothrix sp.]